MVASNCEDPLHLFDFLKGPFLAIQEFYILAGSALRNVFRRPHYSSDIILQMDQIGVGSIPISELGSMKVTEQIDAMRALGTDPIQKLVTPRMIATAVVLPLLTIIADFVGVFGGYVIAKTRLNLEGAQYWSSVWQSLEWNDLAQGLLKPFVFSFAVSLVGCYYGLRTTGGTQGVGRATTQAVVVASVLIFILTFFVTQIFVSQTE